MAFKSLAQYNETRYNGFLTLPNDGDSVDVIFLYRNPDDVVVVDAHYVNSAEYNGYVQCLGPGCPACQKGIRVQTRLFIPCYNMETQEIQFFDRGVSFATEFNQAVFRSVADPSQYVYKIIRHGVARDLNTTYEIRIVGRNTSLPYDVICATKGVSFPDYFNTVCRDMPSHELSRILNLNSGGGQQPVYSPSNIPEYQVTPRAPANANPIPEYVPPTVSVVPAAPTVNDPSVVPAVPSVRLDGAESYNLNGEDVEEPVEF